MFSYLSVASFASLLYLFYLFGVLCRFQHCTGHITTGEFCGQSKPVYTVGQGSVLQTSYHR